MDAELRDYIEAGSPEEAERWRALLAVLASVPAEEPPRRIAFVSDRVLAPKWWERFLPAPALGMGMASVVAAAIVAHGYLARPAAMPVRETAAASTVTVDAAALEARFEKRLAQALAEVSRAHQAELRQAVAVTEKRLDFEHRATMLAVEENYNLLRKQMNRMIVASAQTGSDGEVTR